MCLLGLGLLAAELIPLTLPFPLLLMLPEFSRVREDVFCRADYVKRLRCLGRIAFVRVDQEREALAEMFTLTFTLSVSIDLSKVDEKIAPKPI